MESNTLIYVAIAGLAFFLVIWKIRNRKAHASDIRVKFANGALIVVLGTQDEFASGAYTKAKNIPLDTLTDHIETIPRDKPIVLYCASGARSGQAMHMLKAAGFNDVVSAGGLADMPR